MAQRIAKLVGRQATAVPLIVSIQKGDYKSVEFIENGNSVKKVEIERH